MNKAKMLTYGALAAALVGATISLLPVPLAVSTFALGAGVLLVGAGAWMLGRDPTPRTGAASFKSELMLHASSLVLLVVFMLLALVEVLAIPAAMGKLVVFSSIGIGFIEYYPILTGALLAALAGSVLLAAGGPGLRKMQSSERSMGHAAAGVTGIVVAASFIVATGAFSGMGIRSERSAFVVAAALVSLFFFVKVWLRLPTYADVSAWLERNEELRASGLLRKTAYMLLAFAGVGIVLSLLPAIGVAPPGLGIFGMGVAMLALLGATYNVGVSHIVPGLSLDAGDNALETRKKRKIVLAAISIGLTVLSLAIGLLTFFAFLAQVAGVEIFRFLLEAYVAYYVGIFAVALLPLAAAVGVRIRMKSEVPYSPKLQAIAIMGAASTIILVFFGVFIGSGLAEGSGIQIENAVLVLGGAVLALIAFVKARTLLPGVVGLVREAISTSAQADKDVQDTIKKRMIATYVGALVFVLAFAGYFVASTLGAAPPLESSLGTDLGFFVYILIGIGILLVVVMRYFQSVNMDSRWSKKREENTIGKKRLTSEQVKRYLILGFSIGTAALFIVIGILVQVGALKQLGPIAADRHIATDFFVFGILIGLGPPGWYAAREARRTEAIDQKFPEFLRDLAESQRAGMTLTEAVLTASKGSYGMLTPEIRKMAAQIEWGISFSDALERFSKRVQTPLIDRTVSLVIQAAQAGGNVVDILTAAADDAREIQQIVKERKQSMSIYVMIIYIAFAVFVGVIAVLNAQFIPEVAKAVSKADGVSIGGLNFRAFDQDDFKILFFHAAVIQGLGGGIVGGVMSQGRMVHGLRHSFILVSIAWVLFRLVIG